MTFESFTSYCLTKIGAEETYPFGDHAVWFKVGGKAFAWTFIKPFTFGDELGHPFMFVNLKCRPEEANAMREAYQAIKPGWHQNKKHWNSVFMDGSLSEDKIRELIDQSYEVVVDGLPKKVQASLLK